MCTGREPRCYLNGSHFRACHHFSEPAISPQTDKHTGGQTVRVCECGFSCRGVEEGVGGCVLNPLAPLKVMSCLKVENWWPSPQQGNALEFRRTNNRCLLLAAISLRNVNVLNDGRTKWLEDNARRHLSLRKKKTCFVSLRLDRVLELGVKGQPAVTQTERGWQTDLRLPHWYVDLPPTYPHTHTQVTPQ